MDKNLPEIIETRVVPQRIEENSIEIEHTNTKNDSKLRSDSIQKTETDEPPLRTANACKWAYFGFRYLGFMPTKRFTKAYTYCWRTWILFVVVLYNPTSFILSFIKTSSSDVEISNLLTSAQVMLNVVGVSVKLAVIFFIFPKMKGMENILARLDARCKDEEEFRLMRECVKRGHRFVIFFFVIYFCYSSSTCISGVVVHRLPYNMYNPLVDHTKSNKHFMWAVAMQMAAFDTTVVGESVTDGYNCLYANVLRLHVELLIKRVKKLKFDAEVSGNDCLEANYEELKMCIIDHKNIIELHSAFDIYISKMVFIQFTITGILTSMTMINILIFSTHIAAIVASGLYMLCVVLQIFPICYYCQCLMDEADRLPEVIIHSNWVDQNARYRKLLVFFIQRTQKPMEYVAGKLYPITLNSFLSIAKFSFSLYTFFSQMNIKERLGLE